jgi:hypothetical protein
MFGTLPAYGFYARHAEGLTLRNVRVRWEAEDVRPAMVFDDVRALTVDGFQAGTAAGEAPVVRLHNVVDGWMGFARVPAGVRKLTEVTGEGSREVRVVDGAPR